MRTFNLLSSEAICREFGERIRRLRLLKNLSQLELAQMTQASLSSVRRLESQGQGSFEFWIRAAQALGAVDQLQGLFAVPAQSIADIERMQGLVVRQRARTRRGVTAGAASAKAATA